MPIREDLVASAAKFLQDPTVASSPIENRIAFLQAKNLTQEEVTAALARAGPESGAPQSYPPSPAPSSAAASSSSSSSPAYPAAAQAQPYYGQYPPQYPPYAWQAPPPEVPRRDWRDWFIMATVMGGVGYGLYTLGRRYVYPLVAPPTPERLEQDKKTIDEQFERAFGLVDQLAKDTEALKAAEQARTERLDAALAELETVMTDLKSANRRREDDAQRVRDDVQGLKDAVPRAMTAQKDMTEMRLKEVNAELKSLKTLITQRMNPGGSNGSGNGSGNGVGIGGAGGVSSSLYGYGARLANGDNVAASSSAAAAASAPSSSPAIGNAVYGLATAPTAADEPKRPDLPSAASQSHGTSLFNSKPQSRASIPAWQLAMASKSSGASSGSNGASADAEGSGSSSSAQGSPSAS